MIFYSRENGKDGEKDYIDTNDLKDVYFEADSFDYIEAGRNKNNKITFTLHFDEATEKIFLKGSIAFDNDTLEARSFIDNAVDLVEAGAEAYYAEQLLDSIPLIKSCKDMISSTIKGQLIDRGVILRGTSIDAMGLIENNGNIVAVIDNIVISDANRIVANNNYSITSIDSINAGTLTVFLTGTKAFKGTISMIEPRGNGAITISSSTGFELVDEQSEPYIKSVTFESKEEYTENRAQYIKIDTNVEVDFDEFDDLFN